MHHLARILPITLASAAFALAQEPRDRTTIAAAVKLSRLGLLEAVQKANKALDGIVVGAVLEPATPDAATSWGITVLHEDTLCTIHVDAVTGAVRWPGAATTNLESEEGMMRIGFEDVAIGALPAGWVGAETAGNGRPGSWRVENVSAAPSGTRVMRLAETKNGGETFNLLVSPSPWPADLDLSVRIHADSGEEDQGGGLAWRLKDADNYYVARWNPLEDNVRAYKVVEGKRSMLKSASVTSDAKLWHALRVRASGSTFEVWFDGKRLITFTDATFPLGGKVALWTKADAASSFDELEVAAKR